MLIRDDGEDACVYDSQPAHAIDAQSCVDHDPRSPREHGARAGSVPHRDCGVADVVEDLCVALDAWSRGHFAVVGPDCPAVGGVLREDFSEVLECVDGDVLVRLGGIVVGVDLWRIAVRG